LAIEAVQVSNLPPLQTSLLIWSFDFLNPIGPSSVQFLAFASSKGKSRCSLVFITDMETVSLVFFHWLQKWSNPDFGLFSLSFFLPLPEAPK